MRNGLDAKRDDGQIARDRSLHLFTNMRGGIGACGKYQHHHVAVLNGPGDGFAVRHTGQDIAGSHPAAEAARFDGGAGGVGDPLIFGGVADEYVVGH
jgi:hypothetical protein